MLGPPRGGKTALIDPALVKSPSLFGGTYALRGEPDPNTAWMGPGRVAPVSVVQEGLPTRIWDYPAMWNMRRSPNAGKAQETHGTDFGILRALADQTHVRLVIETVKNQQCDREWVYMIKPQPGDRLSEVKRRSEKDPRIAKVREFFEQPDGKHDWPDWLRLLLEEMLVCDNLSLLFRSFEWNADREPERVEVIDGDTIQVLSDLTGREPDPPDPAYEQWIKGVVFKKFMAPVDRSRKSAAAILGSGPASDRMEELMYLPRNLRVKHFYGFGPVEQLLFYINLIMRRDLTKLAHYTDGNIPPGFIFLPSDATPQRVQEWQNWLDIKLGGDPQARSRLTVAPETQRAVDWAPNVVMQDTFDDAWVRLVTFCFDVSNASLIQHQNRSTSTNAKDQAEEDSTQFGTFVGRVQNYIIRKRLGYADIVAVEQQQIERDAEKQQKIDVAYLAAGKVQVNELRRRDGEDEYPELDGVNGMIIPTIGFVPFPTQEETAAARERSIAGPPEPVAPDQQPNPDDKGATPTKIEAGKAQGVKKKSISESPSWSRGISRY